MIEKIYKRILLGMGMILIALSVGGTIQNLGPDYAAPLYCTEPLYKQYKFSWSDVALSAIGGIIVIGMTSVIFSDE